MAKWSAEAKLVHESFSKGLDKIASKSGLTYSEMTERSGLGAGTLFGLINGTLAPRIDHLPLLVKCFGDEVMELVDSVVKGVA